MCDTLGILLDGGALFAKNSDRSPNEPQVTRFYPAQTGLSGTLAATYIALPQARETRAVLLSQPTWMWGAEIGVNDAGVCVGNEAVFTKGPYGKTGLTGMDLVRLALERADSAASAVETVIALLEKYGQGGNCGYDHEFYYDNSFLILDRAALYVLETAGKRWVTKQYARASISNRLSIGADGDRYSEGAAYDFAKIHTEPVYTRFSGSKTRRAETQKCLLHADSVSDCLWALRTHDEGVVDPFAKGSVTSACMHFGGLVGDHTTASTVVSLEKNRTVAWVTGSSAPCISPFKPWLFGSAPVAPVFAQDDPAGEAYWRAQERFRRKLVGKRIPAEYQVERIALETEWLAAVAAASDADMPALSEKAAAQERAFFEKWDEYAFDDAAPSWAFRKRWAKKNGAFLL